MFIEILEFVCPRVDLTSFVANNSDFLQAVERANMQPGSQDVLWSAQRKENGTVERTIVLYRLLDGILTAQRLR